MSQKSKSTNSPLLDRLKTAVDDNCKQILFSSSFLGKISSDVGTRIEHRE
jgi:hypothetical protein